MNLDQYKEMLEQEKTGTDKEAEKIKEEKMETTPEDGTTEKAVVEEVKKDDVVVIDGQEYTLQEVKSQMLMQKDYTKKTTELSAKKKELAEAEELFKYLQENPQVREALKSAGGDPNLIDTASKEAKEVRRLQAEVARMQLESDLAKLKSKYPDFDDVKVINEAAKRNTTDLEFVYKATRDLEVQPSTQIDREALKKELLEEIRKEQSSTTVPLSMISGKVSSKEVGKTDTIKLTPREEKICRAFNMTPEEYIKQRR